MSGYEIINTMGTLPTNGTVSVVASCPSARDLAAAATSFPVKPIPRPCHGQKLTMPGALISRAMVVAEPPRCMRSALRLVRSALIMPNNASESVRRSASGRLVTLLALMAESSSH